ncbi:actin superfamily [Kluyveromyces marxianus]|nr:actin superfamily [Kluyveromyces marxianus]
MTVVAVVDISSSHIEVGFAGHSRSVAKIQRDIEWLDDDMLTYKTCRTWFHDVLLCDSKDAKVVISEPLWLSMKRKLRISKVLFNRLRVNSITFLPNCLGVFIGAGIKNGLYIEVDAQHTELMPVFEGRLLDLFSQSSKVGYDDMSSLQKDLSNVTLEDTDELSLPMLVSTLRKKLPIDLRNAVLKQLVVVSRNNVVLSYLKEQNKDTSVVESLGSWIGTSIYTWCNLMKGLPDDLEVKRIYFEQHGKIPDWSLHKFEM